MLYFNKYVELYTLYTYIIYIDIIYIIYNNYIHTFYIAKKVFTCKLSF